MPASTAPARSFCTAHTSPHATPSWMAPRRNLRKCMSELDTPDPTTTGVVLLGRGSSDRQANGDVAKMALLADGGDWTNELVDLAFTGITWPRLERAVQRQAMLGMKQVVVLPYYLFTGTLMQRIARQVDHLRQQYPQVRFAQSSYFGFERNLCPAGATRGRPARGRARCQAALRRLQVPRDCPRPGPRAQP